MFSKPFQVKSNSQLKGSTRKKFRTELIKAFPVISEDAFNSHIPNKETISVMKIFTHSREVVHVYSVENGPIAFEKDGQLFPALYLLWKFPDLVYSFTTWPAVLEKIQNGADLMLPGVCIPGGISIHAYGKLEKGDCVSVNLVVNKAPIAVGITAHSSHDMYMCGSRGKCVIMLHFVGDLLWSHGGKYNIPELGPPPGFESKSTPEEFLDDDSETDDEDESDNSYHDETAVDGDLIVPELGEKLKMLEFQDPHPEDSATGEEERSLSDVEAMDKLIRFCFIKALKTSARKVDLPILTSSFYKVHMLHACPDGKTVDLKKSSHKKLGKFLDEIAQEKIIALKELNKGVMSITSINYSHEAVVTFLDLDAVVDDRSQVQEGHCRVGKCMCGLIHSEQTYAVTPSVLPVFSLYANRLGDHLNAASVRKVLHDYVSSKCLQSETNKSQIVCDDVLAKAVLGVSPCEPLAVIWDDLLKMTLARMLDTSALPPPKIHKEDKGKLTPVDIQVATRKGNKKVTLISNLEPYGVDVAEFSKECQRGVAASTTINPLPGRKGVQLQVQGNQVRFVSQLLHDKYQVPLANMRGLNYATKVKGEKKAPPKPKPKSQ